MKRIAFDMERAKSITAGREAGRVVTGEGKSVRLLCFDKKSTGDWVIVGLVDIVEREDPRCYNRNGENMSGVSSSDLWLEVPDEIELRPFDKVLMRDKEDEPWKPRIFAMFRESSISYIYESIGGACYKYCIPYAGNEHLLGTCKSE